MADSQIAVVSDYLSLIAAFRRRIAELGITYESLDALAGWTESYASKLLASEPAKGLGPMSFDAILGAMAVKLVMVDDPEARTRIETRRAFIKRKIAPMRNPVPHEHVVRRDTHEFMRQMGIASGIARRQNMPLRKRVAGARKAAKARWSKASQRARRSVQT